jgi:hypothetical protein
MLKEGLLIDTTFNPHWFSSDYTFKILLPTTVRKKFNLFLVDL